MDKTFLCYIGSNNQTGELETEKIAEIVARFYDGATIQENLIGIWKGEREKTASVLVVSSEEKLRKFIDVAKKELQQDAVAYQETNGLNFR